VRALNRPILSCIFANFLGLLLVAAPACSARFDTDELGADSGAGSSDDDGSDDDGGDDDDGTGDGGVPGDGGEPDGGDDGSEPDGGDDGSEPDAGDDGGDDGPEPDAGEECGGAPGAECCSSEVDSCGDDWIECLEGSTCVACGGNGQPCCEEGDPCNALLGNLTCLVDECGLLGL
jgi:hypothetical protein